MNGHSTSNEDSNTLVQDIVLEKGCEFTIKLHDNLPECNHLNSKKAMLYIKPKSYEKVNQVRMVMRNTPCLLGGPTHTITVTGNNIISKNKVKHLCLRGQFPALTTVEVLNDKIFYTKIRIKISRKLSQKNKINIGD
ncbi:MAG: hypothetical protein IJ848_02145 [Alphaproteobacteria bacterium]|nr:hypothetical protein [Alphaproteobacteria bacterium]